MNKKVLRYIIFSLGVVLLSLGLVLNTKAGLGVSPVISVPYNIASIWNWNFATITFLFYVLCVGLEYVLDFRGCTWLTLLQIPMSFVTSYLINLFTNWIQIQYTHPLQRIGVLVLAITLTGVGVAMIVNMNLVPNPADALANVVGKKLKKGFGLGKNVFDLICLLTSCLLGGIFVHGIIGISYGTMIAVLFTGRVIALFNHFFRDKLLRAAGLAADSTTGATNQKAPMAECSGNLQ